MPKMSKLISKEYLSTQIALHKAPKGYGGRGDKWGPYIVANFAHRLDVLDYGAGQGSLGKYLRAYDFSVLDYDPAYPAFKGSQPKPRALTVCTDVMEHVELERVDAVLDDIAENTLKYALIVIALTPAVKLLPDGRNAHITLMPPEYWIDKLKSRFRKISPISGTSPLRPEKEIGYICHV